MTMRQIADDLEARLGRKGADVELFGRGVLEKGVKPGMARGAVYFTISDFLSNKAAIMLSTSAISKSGSVLATALVGFSAELECYTGTLVNHVTIGERFTPMNGKESYHSYTMIEGFAMKDGEMKPNIQSKSVNFSPETLKLYTYTIHGKIGAGDYRGKKASGRDSTTFEDKHEGLPTIQPT
ncbi:MAG TPA: hypothetical protein VHR66_02840 [Gemmataceae bacterium]|nr:hypothetical protein [Gemmataceae bacterium]